MPPFYNRRPWNLVVGFGGVALVLCAVAALTSWWMLAVPPVLVAFIFILQWVVRAYALLTTGFYARRRPRDHLIYEEVHKFRVRSLSLKLENTEPGHYELFVPPEREWIQSVPDWAKERRTEIAGRIAKSWSREDVHVTDSALGAQPVAQGDSRAPRLRRRIAP